MVGLREKMNWFETKPLFGRSILVTRTAARPAACPAPWPPWGRGHRMPDHSDHPPGDWTAVDEAIDHLADRDWLVLTSPNGVDHFVQRFWRKDWTPAAWPGKNRVIGPATADKLKEFGCART